MLVWLRDASVRLMNRVVNLRVVSMNVGRQVMGVDRTAAAWGFRRGPMKEYDEKMIIQIYRSLMLRSTVDIGSNSVENHSVTYQHAELDDFVLSIEESSNKLRHQFCQQFIFRVLSTHGSHEITLATHDKEQCDANTIPNLMPSGALQFLFLELRKLEQLAEGNVLEADWLMGLLTEMMESIFICVSQNKNILGSAEENTSSEHDDPKQVLICRSQDSEAHFLYLFMIHA
ncbi:uncharacterized protein LOC114716451 [Neltuma alba]|uniref:uncharacterized protein LOC114716451 n=1 Tax=Neltuma alba TaxID=207710 RepID=UPI0010A50355|nr:uncharacterized protein LOC114716451 [Prosopis alba]